MEVVGIGKVSVKEEAEVTSVLDGAADAVDETIVVAEDAGVVVIVVVLDSVLG